MRSAAGMRYDPRRRMAGPAKENEETEQQVAPRVYETRGRRSALRVRWTDRSGEQVKTLEGRVLVGSAPGSPLLVDDPAVSRIHAELEVRDDGLWLRDLDSRNGTFVNDVHVVVCRIPPGGSVRVGGTTLRVEHEASPQPVELWGSDRFGPLLGKSALMRELFARLHRAAKTDSTVLVQGETGTGKELVAQALHDHSRRRNAPLVIVDCASLPEALLESELFGHARGAFTGAQAARQGAVEAAQGGTVLLDEVGELPLALQPKLLRVLESHSVRRVGETAHRKVDVRFLSSTHRDLRTMVNTGAFREDLYFRLAVLPIVVPPLREHLEDVPLLMETFVPRDAQVRLPAAAIEEATRRSWPGNVRELRNFVERVLAFGMQEETATRADPASSAPTGEGLEGLTGALDRPLRQARDEWMNTFERHYLRHLLERADGDVPHAAELAEIDRTHVYRLIRKHER